VAEEAFCLKSASTAECGINNKFLNLQMTNCKQHFYSRRTLIEVFSGA